MRGVDKIVFIDSNVSDPYILIESIPDNYRAFILSDQEDEIQQISHFLEGFKLISALHIVTHGSPGQLNFSNAVLSIHTLEHYFSTLENWSDALAADAELFIYGCETAKGDIGEDFIQILSEKLRVNVAASEGIVGHPDLGGEWELSKRTGPVFEDAFFSNEAQSNWVGILGEVIIKTLPSNSSASYLDGSNVLFGQSFVASESGRLDSVGLSFAPLSDGRVSFSIMQGEGLDNLSSRHIYSANSVVPNEYVGSGADYYFEFGINSDVNVVKGQAYTIVLRPASDSVASLWPSDTAYDDGKTYILDYRLVQGYRTFDDDVAFKVAISTPNTAPSLSGSYDFSETSEDSATSGIQVSTLVSGVTTDDSDSDVLGIAVNGTVGHGTWQFSNDSTNGNDGTWAAFSSSTPLSDSHALLLSEEGWVRYVPDEEKGETASFSFRAWDKSSGSAAVGATPSYVDVSTNGNATAFSSDIATASLVVTDVNDAPTLSSSLISFGFREDIPSPVDLSSLSFSDIDDDEITVTLEVETGTFASPGDGAPYSVTEGLVGDKKITLTGTVGSINSYLDAMQPNYTPFYNLHGNNADTLTISAVDSEGAALAGGNKTVAINLTNSNDAPVVSGSPADQSFTEDTGGNVDLSVLEFSDVDSDNLTVTISASEGVLLGDSKDGVTVAGTGTNVLDLSGTVDEINAWLDVDDNILYVGGKDDFGIDTATLTISAKDEQNSALASDITVNLDITPVNDPPKITSLAASFNVLEDQASDVLLENLTFAEVDGEDITVTFTLSAGSFAAPVDGSVDGVSTAKLNDQQITLTGSASDVNDYIAARGNLKYTGPLNVFGSDKATLTVSAIDSLNTPLVTNRIIDIVIDGVNDAPTVSDAYSLTAIDENTALTGVRVSTLIAGVTSSDVEGDALGMAVNSIVGSGIWQFSNDSINGKDGIWTAFGAGQMPSDNHSLLLSDTAWVRYAPDGENGESVSLTFRAWDQTSGQASSGINARYADTTFNGGDTAFSSGTGSASLTVNGVNDAPTLSAGMAGIAVAEDTTSNVDLSSLTFADVDNSDTLTVTLTITDGTFADPSDGTALGVSATKNSDTQITLQGVSTAINTYLDTASNIRYTGVSNATGNNQATLTVSAIDGAGEVLEGGSIDLAINITAVNDAPTVSGAFSLTGTTEDVSTTGVQVSSLLGSVSKGDVDNDVGSLGVAVNGATGNGLWQFSTNSTDGADGDWVSFNTYRAISDTYAIMFASDTWVRYVPDKENAETVSLSFRTWDQTFGSATSGTSGHYTTVEQNGGDTAFSSDSVSGSLVVTAVNDAPTLSTTLTNLTVTEDTAGNLDLSDLSFADVDNGDNLVVGLAASEGTLSLLGDGSDVGVTVNKIGDTLYTLQGTATSINNYLDIPNNIQYTGTPDASGNAQASLTVSAIDGSGAELVAGHKEIPIDIIAVNDAPTLAGAPADISVTEDVLGNVDLSVLAFSDVDGDNLTVTLSASEGMLVGSSTAEVTVTGNSSQTLSLTGNAIALSSWLDTTSNLSYLGSKNAFGDDAATLTISASDGTTGVSTGDLNVNIDIAGVNDLPTATDGTLTVQKNLPFTFAPSDVGFADVDGDSLNYITITSTPANGTLWLDVNEDGVLGGSDIPLLNGLVVGNAELSAGLLTYLPAQDAIENGHATIEYTVNDGVANSVTSNTWTVDVVSAPVIDLGPAANASFTEGEGFTRLMQARIRIDDDQDFMEGMSIQITDGGQAGDVIRLGNFVDGQTIGGVQVNYVSDTHITLSGADERMHYLELLALLEFDHAGDVVGGLPRKISITGTDADHHTGPTVVQTVTVNGENDAPAATSLTQSIRVAEDAGVTDISPVAFTVTDADGTTEGLTATLTLSDISSGSLAGAGGVFDAATGVWTTTGNALGVQTALNNVTFTPNADHDQNLTIAVNIADGGEDGASAQTGTIYVEVTPSQDKPTGSDSTKTVPYSSGYTFTVSDFGFSDPDTGDRLARIFHEPSARPIFSTAVHRES